MQFKVPKNDEKYRWTQHVVRKMMFYGLSADRVKRVIRAPQRMEEGIAPETLAAMQVAGNKKKPTEIWVMYVEENKKAKVKMSNVKVTEKNNSTFDIHTSSFFPTSSRKVIITAWRYPGVSPVRGQIPIPANILQELKKELKLNEY